MHYLMVEGLKMHLKGKKIGLKSALSGRRGLESTLKRKNIGFVKKKMIFMKKWTFFWSGIVVLDNLSNDFWNGQIIMGDLPRWRIQRLFQIISL